MTPDDAIRMAFQQACVDFRRADLDGMTDKAKAFMDVANSIEDAYPELLKKVKNLVPLPPR